MKEAIKNCWQKYFSKHNSDTKLKPVWEVEKCVWEIEKVTGKHQRLPVKYLSINKSMIIEK